MPCHPDRVRRNYLPEPTETPCDWCGHTPCLGWCEYDETEPHECRHCGAGPECRIYSSAVDTNYCLQCHEDWP